MKNLQFALLLFFTTLVNVSFVNAQVTLTESNLPIVILETEDTEINDLFAVGVQMKIIYRGDGQTTFVTDQDNPLYQEYIGRAGFKIRGNSSADFPKKQYSVEFWDEFDNPNSQAVFDMPKENDWVLNAPYFDRSLMRNVVGYQLSNEMGQYASKTKFCEVILDGDYKGIYVFIERIKVDKNRVDVESLDSLADNSLPNITGGYIWRVDKGPNDFSDGFITENNGQYRYFDPEIDEMSVQQQEYLANEIESFEDLMLTTNYSDPLTGYASKIDVSTFVDQILLQEISDNLDAYRSSTYYHKYRNGKLRMGPVWDLNFAFGSYGSWGADTPTGWRMDEPPTAASPRYNRKLFGDETFECLMNQRWFSLRASGQPYELDNIMGIIDSVYNLLNQGAQQRNFQRWPSVLGQSVYTIEAPGYQDRDTYLKEVDYFKQWFIDRFAWMDANMPSGVCPAGVPDGLVINELMYNPEVSLAEIEGDYEFIEIYNNGNSIIDLTGVQLSMGIHYTFSSGTIAPGEYLVLAGNTIKFQERYGFMPYDEFAGGIDNGGEKIILADTYGFILDEVSYNDILPWPILADGNGASLELLAPNLDNQDAANWFANFNPNGSPGVANVQQTVNCDPPAPQIVINEINYKSSDTADAGDWVELKNISGSAVNLEGWSFQDEGNTYVFPANTVIMNNAYLVLAQDILLFSTQHPTVSSTILQGPIGFGFGNGGEQLSLLDNRGCEVDVVLYDDIAPWPTEPDGNGNTLELLNSSFDNNLANSWGVSNALGGTPGMANGGNSNPNGGLSIKLFLEGYLNETTLLMKTDLYNENLIPTQHPYNTVPYLYNGNEQTGVFPNNTVDWVLVEIRSSLNQSQILERKALLLRNDGFVMQTNGSTSLEFNITGSHYIVVYHRSHLGVMSAIPTNIENGSIDLTTSTSTASGLEQLNTIAGKSCLFAGDYDGNGLINNLDYNIWGSNNSAVAVYYSHDGDGNGLINNLDFNKWDLNKSKVGIPEIQK